MKLIVSVKTYKSQPSPVAGRKKENDSLKIYQQKRLTERKKFFKFPVILSKLIHHNL